MNEESQILALHRVHTDLETGPPEIKIVSDECPVFLGRGPLLQIADTRISRKQAQVEWCPESKRWTLVSNKSMIFAEATRKEGPLAWKTLSSGEREIIEEGCSIGFIDADAFTFKTSILQSDTKCLGHSSPQKGRAPVEDPSKVPEGCSSPTPLKKQRVLPAWMTKDSKNTELASEPKETTKHDISDDDEPDESEIKSSEKRVTDQLNPTSDNHETPTPSTTVLGPGLTSSDSASRRPSCPYGGSCYRQNPQHKADEAHPGDDDYMDPTSDGAIGNDSDKPECEYGIDCYRQNPQHRKDYRHTSKPRPPKRKAAKAGGKKKKKRDGSGDEEDYDSSFIDDEEFSSEEDITSEEEDEWKPDEDSD